MTQKELLYLEDAVSHEQIIIDGLNHFLNELESSTYRDFISSEIEVHMSLKKNLISFLKEES
jgi:hypothetical protein